MRISLRIPGLLIALSGLACGGLGGPSADDPPASTAPQAAPRDVAPPAAAPTGAQDKPVAGVDAIPNLLADIDKGGCEGPGNEGARNYFYGTYTLTGDIVSGTEQWLIYANEKLMRSKFWVADGGKTECIVTWRVNGSTTTPKACGACDTAIAIHASVDVSATTCPEGLWEKEQEREFDVTYDVRRRDDGTALFYFHQSGKQLGQGYHAAGALAYLTDPSCQWF